MAKSKFKPFKQTCPINELKKGDFFKLKKESSVVYVYKGFNRFSKKYSYIRWDDINAWYHKKKGTIVFLDFEF